MKTRISRRHAAGFSLMELMVVVAIIVVLAGLTIGALALVRGKQARDKAGVQVQLLANALEKYYSDNRSYPQNDEAEGKKGDEVLYKALYWEGLQAKEANTTGGATIYVPEFDPLNNTKGGQAWIQGTGENAHVVDPWTNPFRYRTGKSAINPDYDLWSAGPDGKTNADPKHKDCFDDIKLK